jgi:hypothetical protein
MDTPRRLDSWKEIAEYLGHDVRTAIRWEQERGLPVHRMPGTKRSSVFAFTGEIDRWLLTDGVGGDGHASAGVPPGPGAPLQADDQPSPRHPHQRSARARWLALLVASVVLVLLGLAFRAYLFSSRRPGVPRVTGIALSGTALRAYDEAGTVLWAHDFGRAVEQRQDPDGEGFPETFSWSDIDSDSVAELLVSVAFGNLSGNDPPGNNELFAFSATGRVLWSHRLEDTLTFGAGRYGPPWHGLGPSPGRALAVFEVDGQKRIAWAQSHATWWPSVLTILDASGRPLSKWVHSGVIYTVVPWLSPNGTRLLVGGVSNSREAAFLSVLDARRVEGSGPEEPGSPYECLSCPPGRPLVYFTMSPSELMLATSPYNLTFDIRPDVSGFEARTRETSDPSTTLEVIGITRFSSGLVLEHAAWSSSWEARHHELERERKLDHAIGQCPERGRPPRVREWTPGGGWRELTPAGGVRVAAGPGRSDRR